MPASRALLTPGILGPFRGRAGEDLRPSPKGAGHLSSRIGSCWRRGTTSRSQTSSKGSVRVLQSRARLVCEGKGRSLHFLAVLSLIPADAAALFCDLPCFIFCLSSLTRESVTMSGALQGLHDHTVVRLARTGKTSCRGEAIIVVVDQASKVPSAKWRTRDLRRFSLLSDIIDTADQKKVATKRSRHETPEISPARTKVVRSRVHVQMFKASGELHMSWLLDRGTQTGSIAMRA